MSDTKISALTALTTPDAADVFPIVDVSASQTKKITFANLLVAIIAGSTGTPIRDENVAASGSGTSFVLLNTPITNTLQLFRNGVRISIVNGDYTISGVNITLTNALANGETLTADYSH